MIQGSNTIQFEPCVRVVVRDGHVTHIPSMRFRTADVSVSLLGVTLGAWSEWRWVDNEPVFRLPDGTACDSMGIPA